MLDIMLAWRLLLLEAVRVHKLPFSKAMVKALASLPATEEQAAEYFVVAVKFMKDYETNGTTITTHKSTLSVETPKTARELAAILYYLNLDGGVLRVAKMGESEVTAGEPLIGFHEGKLSGGIYPSDWETGSDDIYRLTMRKDVFGALSLSSRKGALWGVQDYLWIKTAGGLVTRMAWDAALLRHVEENDGDPDDNSIAIWEEGLAALGGLFAFTVHTALPTVGVTTVTTTTTNDEED